LFGLFVVSPVASVGFEWRSVDLRTLPLQLIALRNVEPKGVFPYNPCPGIINGSLWSIPYEFKCYLFVMLVGGLGLFRADRRILVGLLIAIITGSFFYRPDSTSVVERGPFAVIIGQVSFWCNVLPYFVAGMADYLYRDQIPRSRQFLAAVSVILVISAAVPPAGRVVFPLAITYLLFWFAFQSPCRFYGWSRYGDFSYGIYLYAFPLQQLMTMRFPGTSPIVLFLISTPLSVIAGVLSWHLLEKHFLKRAATPA
jgi:peptidoglycan/LPS O-acetylase OafA/YrhL